MPLDTDTQAVLQQFEELGMPALGDLPPEQARAVFNEAFKTPEEAKAPVAHVEDRTIPGPAGEIPVRIYKPESSGPLPALVHYHGGGWVIMGLDTHDGLCRQLANGVGAVVVSVDYRLAPEHPYPAAAEDCYAALCWVHDHAGAIGVDPARLAVIGDSAGGNLAAVVAQTTRDRHGPGLAGQILTYPVTDGTREHPSVGENAEGYLLTQKDMHYFWGHYVPDRDKRAEAQASPLMASDLSGLAPALVVTAEFDPLRDEGEAYARALEAAGVKTEHQRYDGTIHGFLLMPDQIAKGRQALEQEMRFAREVLGR